MRRSRPIDLLVLTGVAWALVAVPANAYIDAGSVSVIFQAVVAAVAAGWFAVKLAVARGLGFLGRRAGEGAEVDAAPTDADATETVTSPQDT